MEKEQLLKSIEKEQHARKVLSERDELVKKLELEIDTATSDIHRARLMGVLGLVNQSITTISQQSRNRTNEVLQTLGKQMGKVDRLHERGYLPTEDYTRAKNEHDSYVRLFQAPAVDTAEPIQTAIPAIEPAMVPTIDTPEEPAPVVPESIQPQQEPLPVDELQVFLNQLTADEQHFISILKAHPDGISSQNLRQNYGINPSQVAAGLRKRPEFQNFHAEAPGAYGKWYSPDITPGQAQEKVKEPERHLFYVDQKTGKTISIHLRPSEWEVFSMISKQETKAEELDKHLQEKGIKTGSYAVVGLIRSKAEEAHMPSPIGRGEGKYQLTKQEGFSFTTERHEVETMRTQVALKSINNSLAEAGVTSHQYVADTSPDLLRALLPSQDVFPVEIKELLEVAKEGMTVGEFTTGYMELLWYVTQVSREPETRVTVAIPPKLVDIWHKLRGLIAEQKNNNVASNILTNEDNLLNNLQISWAEQKKKLTDNTYLLGQSRSIFHPRSLFYLLRQAGGTKTETRLQQALYTWLGDDTIHHLPIDWDQNNRQSEYIDGVLGKLFNGERSLLLNPSYLQTVLNKYKGLSVSDEEAVEVVQKISALEEQKPTNGKTVERPRRTSRRTDNEEFTIDGMGSQYSSESISAFPRLLSTLNEIKNSFAIHAGLRSSYDEIKNSLDTIFTLRLNTSAEQAVGSLMIAALELRETLIRAEKSAAAMRSIPEKGAAVFQRHVNLLAKLLTPNSSIGFNALTRNQLFEFQDNLNKTLTPLLGTGFGGIDREGNKKALNSAMHSVLYVLDKYPEAKVSAVPVEEDTFNGIDMKFELPQLDYEGLQHTTTVYVSIKSEDTDHVTEILINSKEDVNKLPSEDWRLAASKALQRSKEIGSDEDRVIFLLAPNSI